MIPIDYRFPDDWAGKAPPLFKYGRRVHVDSFLRTGRLKLTTYGECKVMDSTRRDRREGMANSLLNFSDGGAVAGVHGVGRTSYMFCTSMKEGAATMELFEGAETWFRIDDVDGFAQAIGETIQGCNRVLVGPCRYVPARLIERRDVQRPDASELIRVACGGGDRAAIERALEGFHQQLGDMVQGAVADVPYFVKVAESHEREAEFRFVWLVDHAVPEGPVTPIDVPAVVQFCSAAA